MSYGFIRAHPAAFYRPLPDGLIQCQLCPHNCEVLDGDRGECGVRENRQGQYYTLAYGNPCAIHLDPVETKPFFHLLPGSGSFSIATAGCNLHCKFCQNWEISQARPDKTLNFDLPPEMVVAGARQTACPSIAHTYVEPIIFYEYMVEVGRLAKKAGILNTCHSAGYINPEPLEKLTEVLDAACIDLKSFSEAYYRDVCEGGLAPVLAALKQLKRRKVHTEIVTLIVPGKNDDMREVAAMCAWIKAELGPDTPLHFSRFTPLYKLRSLPPTPVPTLERACETARKAGLNFVYLGNVPGHPFESTSCPKCGSLLIARLGFTSTIHGLKDGRCAKCGRPVPGIWS
jgi:pyruvate formate lyase activating enzyme